MQNLTEIIPNSQRDKILHQYFGHRTLRPGQSEAVDAALSARDALIVLPTGAGKSLCFQLPAMVFFSAGRGTTLVISPLIALMRDQVQHLQALGIPADALHSQQDELENRAIAGKFMTGKLALLYVSPERAVLAGFQRMCSRIKIPLLAIDEAHCISQWGHDFRPEYRQLHQLRAQLGATTLGLTATATPKVRMDISRSLELRDPLHLVGSFARHNLRFSVHHLRSETQRLSLLDEQLDALGFRSGYPGRAIVYCATRKKVEKVADFLSKRGLPVAWYHAGRSEKARHRAHDAYELGKRPILVATNAFGMGIDHANVRLIVHFQTPGSIEAYYQEAGRAGRDGADADCMMMFGAADMMIQRRLASGRQGSDLLSTMDAYAHAESCRQQFLCNYFGAPLDKTCGCCDVCRNTYQLPQPQGPKVNIAPLDDTAREIIVAAVTQLHRPVGKTRLAQALRGSRAKILRTVGLHNLPQHGDLAAHSEASIVATINALLQDGLLEHRGRKYPTIWLAGRAVRLSQPTHKAASKQRRPSQSDLRRALHNYRQRTARTLKWKPYMVFQNKVLDAIESVRPDCIWDLEQIHGVGPAKVERFGKEILDIVRRHESMEHQNV